MSWSLLLSNWERRHGAISKPSIQWKTGYLVMSLEEALVQVPKVA